MIINSTTAYCNICHTSHPAVIETHEGKVVGKINCFKGERDISLSSDAEMFIKIREKSQIDLSESVKDHRFTILNFLDITNTCNFQCPICGVNSGKKRSPIFLTPQEAYLRAKKLKECSGRNITLTGGEPTIHPDLPEIIQKIRMLNLHITIASNGLRLGTDKNYARVLKKSGLSKVVLQFDTFNKVIHRKLRGNEYIDEKIQAIDNIIKAGLRLGLITTVTTLNIDELGHILKFGLSFAPQLSTIVFQGASPTGRYQLSEDTLVDREQIIHVVLKSKILPGVTMDDVWPLPIFRPWGLQLHPDCGVNMVVFMDGKTVKPISKVIDIKKLYSRMSLNRMKPSWVNRILIPFYYILTSIKSGRYIEFFKNLTSFLLLGSKRRGIVIIGLGSYATAHFQDEQKITLCPVSQLTHSGLISPCIYDLCDEKFPGSRKNDELHQIV